MDIRPPSPAGMETDCSLGRLLSSLPCNGARPPLYPRSLTSSLPCRDTIHGLLVRPSTSPLPCRAGVHQFRLWFQTFLNPNRNSRSRLRPMWSLAPTPLWRDRGGPFLKILCSYHLRRILLGDPLFGESAVEKHLVPLSKSQFMWRHLCKADKKESKTNGRATYRNRSRAWMPS